MFQIKKIKELEKRIRALEYPYELKVGDKVYGHRLWANHYDSRYVKGRVVGQQRDSNGIPYYDVYFKNKNLSKKISLRELITEKPKKDEDTKA